MERFLQDVLTLKNQNIFPKLIFTLTNLYFISLSTTQDLNCCIHSCYHKKHATLIFVEPSEVQTLPQNRNMTPPASRKGKSPPSYSTDNDQEEIQLKGSTTRPCSKGKPVQPLRTLTQSTTHRGMQGVMQVLGVGLRMDFQLPCCGLSLAPHTCNLLVNSLVCCSSSHTPIIYLPLSHSAIPQYL